MTCPDRYVAEWMIASQLVGRIWAVDAGHAWLVVPLDAVRRSGARISSYSYQDTVAGVAYLEEDCDAYRYLAATGQLGPDNRPTVAIDEAPPVDWHPCRRLPSYVDASEMAR